MKDRKSLFYVITFTCFIAAGVCAIVNMAVNGGFTWALYPFISIPFAWLVVVPLLLKRNSLLFSLLSLTVFVIPYLWLMEKITPASGWLIPLGVPAAIIGIIVLWVCYLLFRLIKINIWYKSAITVFVVGVIASPIVRYFADKFAGIETQSLDNLINIFSCLVAAAALGIFAYKCERNQKA